MKAIRVLGTFMMLVLVTACSSVFVSNKKLMEITPGMTSKEVMKIMGSPENRRFEGQYEEWEFRRTTYVGDSRVILVRFIDGKVTAMESFDVQPPIQPVLPVAPHSDAR